MRGPLDHGVVQPTSTQPGPPLWGIQGSSGVTYTTLLCLSDSPPPPGNPILYLYHMALVGCALVLLPRHLVATQVHAPSFPMLGVFGRGLVKPGLSRDAWVIFCFKASMFLCRGWGGAK